MGYLIQSINIENLERYGEIYAAALAVSPGMIHGM
jgi:hypothetical protein